MKKFLCFAMVAMLATVPFAQAGDTDLYMVVTEQGGATCVSTAAGDNAALYLAPADQVAAVAANSGQSPTYDVGSIAIRANVAEKNVGPTGDEIVSSVGIDIGASATGTTGLTASAWAFTTLAANSGTGADPWSGTNNATVAFGAAPTLVTDARAVAVPASSGDPLWGGYAPGTGYTVANMTLAAGNSSGACVGDALTTYNLNMVVGAVKITRVVDPNAGPASGAEMVSFGYVTGVPETAVSGSSVGAGAGGAADAVVYIWRKGDAGSIDQSTGDFLPGVPDGCVDADDLNWIYEVSVGNQPVWNAAEYQHTSDVVSIDQSTGDPLTTVLDCTVDADDLNALYNWFQGT